MKRRVIRSAVVAGLFVAAYAGLLFAPQPLFAYSVRVDTVTLYSDHPLATSTAERVLRLSGRKLEASPLFATRPAIDVFICNTRWRQVLFFNKDYGVGGVVHVPSDRVFLRPADVDENRLMSPRGVPVPGDRTLDYFVAHEATHALEDRALGMVGFYKMPRWVREGYADYVGKGSEFDYASARAAFLADAKEMDWQRSGLYSRFHLLVAFMLERRHWDVQRLLEAPPPQKDVERWVREDR